MHATRRKRLQFLLATRFGGDRQALIAASGKTKGRISQLLEVGSTFGERAARSIEDSLGLPAFYLDIEDDDPNIWPEDVKRIGRVLLSMSADERGKVLAIIQALKAPTPDR
jgi:hypothetical protein